MKVDSLINIEKLTSFEDILTRLKKLETSLATDGLAQFEVFNKAYYVVTSTIKKAAENGYFTSPEFIEKFTICFAGYYFLAVNETINKSPKLPEAWAMVNKAGKHKATPKFILLLMGANAHINHDLPLALLSQSEGIKNQSLIGDVIKVDKLLKKCGREIIHTFNEKNRLLNTIKRWFVFLYFEPVIYMILYWRVRAWRSFLSLKKIGIKNSNYSNYSFKVSKCLLKFGLYF